MMKIKQYDFKREYSLFASEYEAKAVEILRSGWYTLGEELKTFEKEWAHYIGVKHCVGVGSGLDALWITMRLLGIGAGDEVIVQANTYIATVMGITINGATPVFVEPDMFYGIDASKIEEKITEKTKAVIVVSLYGMPCQMDVISDICRKHNLFLLEDAAQSHGAKFNAKMTGTFGDAGCFSFFPSKTLGAFGEAGGIVTNDGELAEKARIFRNYGSDYRYHFKTVGTNSRLDEMQAGLLRTKLKHLDELIKLRKAIVKKYRNQITNTLISHPQIRDNADSTWHQYVIRIEERDRFKEYLEDNGIGTYIHYPIPPHLSEAYESLGYKRGDFPITEKYSDTVISLPLYAGMTDEEIEYVLDIINKFY